MITTLNTLRAQLILPKTSDAKIIAAINAIGHEVETVFQPSVTNQKLVVGEIKDIKKHPSATKLSVCQVDVNSEAFLNIICGANNFKLNDKVVVALVGASLANDVIITKRTIANITSEGMLCSLVELGYNTKNLSDSELDGIHILPHEAACGTSPFNYLNDDVTITVKFTPNRGDCLSVRGLAHDIAAYLNCRLRPVEKYPVKLTALNPVKINLQSSQNTLYLQSFLPNVKISESPLWLQEFLTAHDVRVINNVVDLTNYVMLLTGVPLHAYDYDVTGPNFTIFENKKPLDLTIFNETKFVVKPNCTIIGDESNQKIFALAGVSGAINSGISFNTNNIVIEAANWDSYQVRKTAHQLNLYTEASRRFSYGVDNYKFYDALQLFLGLVQKLGICANAAPINKVLYELPPIKHINLSIAYLKKLTGFFLEQREMAIYLSRLGFKCIKVDMDILTVIVPSFRLDINNETDLVEEVVRLINLDKIPNLPLNLTVQNVDFQYHNNFLNCLKICDAFGLNNVTNYALVPKENANKFNLFNYDDIAIVNNSASMYHQAQRLMLLPSLLKNFVYNYNHHQTLANYAEFDFINTLKTQKQHLAGLLSLPIHLDLKNASANEVTFADAQALLVAVINHYCNHYKKFINIDFQLEKNLHCLFYPRINCGIYVNDVKVGYLGKICANLTLPVWNMTINHDLFGFEICLTALDKLISSLNNIDFKIDNTLLKHHVIHKDFAFITSNENKINKFINALKTTNNVYNVKLFDLYQLNDKEVSFAVKVTFSNNNNFTTKVVEQLIAQINSLAKTKFDLIAR